MTNTIDVYKRQTLKNTPDSIQKNIDEVIDQVKTASGGTIASEKVLNTTVEKINTAVTNGMELSQVLAANGLNSKTYYKLVQAYYSVQTLEQVKTQFTKQIATSASDIKKLTDGMDAVSYTHLDVYKRQVYKCFNYVLS